MKIAIIGKFQKMWDEEYIARGFENLGHEVQRIEQTVPVDEIKHKLVDPDLVLWTKLRVDKPIELREYCRKFKTACWVFDLYWGYVRENQLQHPSFTADYIFTTDGGHEKEFKEAGMNHFVVRQGIRSEECFLDKGEPEGVVFVGTHNPYNPYRMKLIEAVKGYVSNFKWYGSGDEEEVRGTDLNELYANTKIVIGDSVYSPHYWSNRVVETLGRGGFLIHPDVPGLKEAYPYLITYDRDNFQQLKDLLRHYLIYTKEREELRVKNFQWVKDNYTIEKQCEKLLSHIK